MLLPQPKGSEANSTIFAVGAGGARCHLGCHLVAREFPVPKPSDTLWTFY